jgi:hypothetical protein
MNEEDLVQRLMWSALIAGLGFVISIASERLAAVAWRRIFGTEPPKK